MLSFLTPTITSTFVICVCVLLFIGAFWVESFAATPPQDREIDVDLMLEAIRLVENWDGKARGAAGERGPWQMTRPIWQTVSDKPFDWADSPNIDHQLESHRAAREWVYEIRQKLRENKIPAKPFNVALVWTSGWGVFQFYHPKPVTAFKRDYAQRAVNLYLDLLKQQEAETPERHK